MKISLSPFAPEHMISRNGSGSSVPRQPAHLHTLAEYGAVSSRVPRRRLFFYLNCHIRHRVSPEFIGSRTCIPVTFTAKSPPEYGTTKGFTVEIAHTFTSYNSTIFSASPKSVSQSQSQSHLVDAAELELGLLVVHAMKLEATLGVVQKSKLVARLLDVHHV